MELGPDQVGVSEILPARTRAFAWVTAALAIETANVGFAAYFEEIGRVGLMEENKENTSVFISGTKVREQLGNGEFPDPRIMRESTAKILVDYYASQG